MLSLIVTNFIFVMCYIVKLVTIFSFWVVITVSSMMPTDIIINIVAIPDAQKLVEIIEMQKQVNSQSSPRGFYTNRQVRDALSPAFLLLSTCKNYYSVDRERLNAILVNNLSQFLISHSAIFLFPRATCHSTKYYPSMCKDLIRALYSENLVNNSVAIKNYVGSINGNTIILHKFHPTLTICMLLERIIGCTMSFMKNRNDNAVKNCITVIDYIYLQGKTDLRVCGMNDYKKNLAHHLFDLFNDTCYQPFFKYFSLETQEEIKNNCMIKKSDHSVKVIENESIIKDLLEAYLPPFQEQDVIKYVE